jgi:glycosyltransferase involved in cell wall biosynthesis
MLNLSVIVPFFNEENTLKESVTRLINENIFDQIILSNNNSTDSSPEIAKTLEREFVHIKYITSDTNLGKGNAINAGSKEVSTTHVVIHDADLEYFPKDIFEMYQLAKENPDSLILGSRFIGTKNRKNLYIRTYVANKVMSIFFSFVNLYWVTDIATCYKLMPSKFFKEMSIQENGFSIEVEILSKFLNYNRSIIEVPISYEGRSYSEGKKIKLSDGFMYIVNTLKYRLR